MLGATHSWHLPIVEKVVPIQLMHCVRSAFGPVPAAHAGPPALRHDHFILQWVCHRNFPSLSAVSLPRARRLPLAGHGVLGRPIHQRGVVVAKQHFAEPDRGLDLCANRDSETLRQFDCALASTVSGRRSLAHATTRAEAFCLCPIFEGSNMPVNASGASGRRTTGLSAAL